MHRVTIETRPEFSPAPLIADRGIPAWDASDRPGSEIIYNLAESTTAPLSYAELVSMHAHNGAADLNLDYPPTQGLRDLRDAIGQHCGVAGDWVLTTQGAAFALFLLAFELCRPGDDVVVVVPCFAPARRTLESCGASVRTVALRFEDGYHFDAARVACAVTPDTRLVSIASPHNPSGIHVSASSVRQLLDALADRAPRALLLVDETFREACYGDTPAVPSVAGMDPRVITTSSISKAYGTPGLRIGWLTIPDPTLRTRLVTAKASILISGSMLDETLATGLLASPSAALADRCWALAVARGMVADWQTSVSPWVAWVAPEAGALSAFRLRTEAFDDGAVAQFWRGLSARGVRVAAGSWFGDEDRVFRLGFAALPIGTLKHALAALAEVLAATGR